MRDALRRLHTRPIRSGVICFALLVTTLGSGPGTANAIGTGTGMPQPLSITHQPPSTIEPWLDLVLSFSVSGDCEGDPPGAYAYADASPLGGPTAGTGMFVSKGCGPLSGGVSYDFGTGQKEVAATFAPRDSQGLRAGTVTIPGSGLPSGATLTYTISSRQSRSYTTTSGGVGWSCGWLPCFPYPYVQGPTESDTLATASKSATIRISGDRSPKAPSAPTLSAAAVAGGCCIDLSWTAASANGAPVTNYKVYRGTSSSMLSSIGTFGNITTLNDSVSKGVIYYYAVSAFNSYGEGARSNITSALILRLPQAVVVSADAEPTGIRLNWSWNHGSDGSSLVTKFKIYRATESGERSLLTTLNKVDSNNTFLDTQVVDGTYYNYWVNAVSAVGEGPFRSGSGALFGTPMAPVILTPSPPEGSVQPAYFKVSGTVTPGMTVLLYRDDVLGGPLWLSGERTSWEFNAGGLEGKATYHVTARSPQGLESAASNSITVDIDSVAPEGEISGTWVNHEAGLWWNPDTSPVGTSPSSLISGTLNGTASDNRSVREVRLTYWQSETDALVRPSSAVTSCECGGPSATWSDSPNLPPGAYNVHLHVYDVAGNVSGRRYPLYIFGTEIP